MAFIYWFHAHRDEPKLNGIKLGCTARKEWSHCDERMRHNAWTYSFTASKLESARINAWLDLKKIEEALHYNLGRRYPRMNARLRPAEVFDLGDEDYDEAVQCVKEWIIDDLMADVYNIGEWDFVQGK